MDERKHSPDSLLTIGAQTAEYERTMDAEARARQVRLESIAAGRCICVPGKVRRRWPGEDTPRVRTVHAEDCPKRRAWMAG